MKMYRLWLSRLGREAVCESCGEKITEKDTVKPRRVGGSNTHTVHYHLGCYEERLGAVSVKEEKQRINLAILNLFDRIVALEREIKK